MKKILRITLFDNTVIDKDLSEVAATLPIGAPANHPEYQGVCRLAMAGLMIASEKDYLKWEVPMRTEIIFKP